MTRYYFHLHNLVGFVPDEEGQELPDLPAARKEAIVNVRSVLAEEVREGELDLRGRVEIASEAGEVVAVIPLSEAVSVRFDEGEP